jgi:hypothetical protein
MLCLGAIAKSFSPSAENRQPVIGNGHEAIADWLCCAV